jgi:tRNA1(Val) A37 N6-methylase TrmN6
VALAERSIRWNGLVDRVQVRQGDLRHRSSLAPAAYELVTGTPPYLAPERGVISPMPQRGECRFELRGGVERYLEAAAYALRPGGLATLVQAWRDHERVLRRAGELGLVPALSQPVVFREHREPAIGLYAFTHAAVEWELDPLLVRGSDGAYSEAFRTVRRKMGYPLEQGFASGS